MKATSWVGITSGGPDRSRGRLSVAACGKSEGGEGSRRRSWWGVVARRGHDFGNARRETRSRRQGRTLQFAGHVAQPSTYFFMQGRHSSH